MREINKRIHILISGRVQGVFFRASAKRVADHYAIVGYAKNLQAGTVEIVAEGPVPALRKLLDWCYRGSLMAHVDSLNFKWLEATGEFSGFLVELDKSGFVADKVHALTNLGRRVLDRVDKSVNKEPPKIPKHVVVIPDGNRRWARERGLPVWQGHKEGMERTKELVRAANEHGVKHMTFWGFSTENWSRPKEEIDWIMKALAQGIREFTSELLGNNIGFIHLGRKDRLPGELNRELALLEDKTRNFSDKSLALAIDYGGRDELVRAIQKMSEANQPTSQEAISSSLDTKNLPDPDLIIRTSGEQRTSGIMPWQGVYSELYFSPMHYPDFGQQEFAYALAEYAARERRRGS
jgi:undecaprenyl diphosphate synthase